MMVFIWALLISIDFHSGRSCVAGVRLNHEFLELLKTNDVELLQHDDEENHTPWSCSLTCRAVLAVDLVSILYSLKMKFHTLALLSLALLSSSCGVAAFIIMAPTTPSSARRLHSTLGSQLRLSNSPQDSTTTTTTTTTTTNKNAIMQSLTPELLKMTLAFRDIGDDKLRYKQLLYMATHQLPRLENPEQVMIAANKVPGCLSTVYIDGTATYSNEKQDYVVDFVGESDGLLTKGLVALLVRYVHTYIHTYM
jgi:sulfur transfer protein SufE